MKLDDWRKKDVLDSLETLTITSNESTRTHKVIGVLLSHIIKQDRAFDYVSQHHEDGLITDFEVKKDRVIIHILEAKVSAALGDSEGQLKTYLSSRGCERGCLTDGYIWQFYKLLSHELIAFEKPVYTEHDLDVISERITEGY